MAGRSRPSSRSCAYVDMRTGPSSATGWPSSVSVTTSPDEARARAAPTSSLKSPISRALIPLSKHAEGGLNERHDHYVTLRSFTTAKRASYSQNIVKIDTSAVTTWWTFPLDGIDPAARCVEIGNPVLPKEKHVHERNRERRPAGCRRRQGRKVPRDGAREGGLEGRHGGAPVSSAAPALTSPASPRSRWSTRLVA